MIAFWQGVAYAFIIFCLVPITLGFDEYTAIQPEVARLPPFKRRVDDSERNYSGNDYLEYRKQLIALKRKSHLMYWMERTFFLLQFFSPFQWSGSRNPHVNELAKWVRGTRDEVDNKRAKKVDIYLMLFWLTTIAIIFFFRDLQRNEFLRGFLIVFIIVRLMDILQTTINQSLFNGPRYRRWETTLNERNLIIAVISYLEVAALFGIAYLLAGGLVQGICETPVNDRLSTIYFSVSTQFTVGFGDIHAKGCTKLLVICQTFVALPLIAIIIVRAVNSIPAIKARS